MDELITAKRAAELSDEKRGDKEALNTAIIEAAQKGEKELDLRTPLADSIIEELKLRGFKVINWSGVAIQKEGLYHRIKW